MSRELTAIERKAIRDYLRWRGHSPQAADAKVDLYMAHLLAAPERRVAQSEA